MDIKLDLEVLDQAGLDLETAMAQEWRHGMASLHEGLEGAARFVGGAGRHGERT